MVRRWEEASTWFVVKNVRLEKILVELRNRERCHEVIGVEALKFSRVVIVTKNF